VWFPSYDLLKIKESASTQDVAHLKGNYMIAWKIPGHKHLIYILYSLLQVLDIIDFCAINSTI
jgi:hypothetical protein